MPSKAAREIYLKHKEPSLTKKELKEWAKLNEGFSFAHLKEMIIANRIFDIPVNETITRLKEMKEEDFSNETLDEEESTMGFSMFPVNSTG